MARSLWYALLGVTLRVRNKRVSAAVFLAMGAIAVGWLSLHERDESAWELPVAADAGADAVVEIDAGAVEVPPPAEDLDAGLEPLTLDAGFDMPDGGKVPSLDDTPKSVGFGVILVQYAGAQGAKRSARSRDEARALIDELAALAKDDFAAAVKKGDPGSVTDAGRMFRGILEPVPEAVLFKLEKGAVSKPVDTPRGFWVVKRID